MNTQVPDNILADRCLACPTCGAQIGEACKGFAGGEIVYIDVSHFGRRWRRMIEKGPLESERTNEKP